MAFKTGDRVVIGVNAAKGTGYGDPVWNFDELELWDAAVPPILVEAEVTSVVDADEFQTKYTFMGRECLWNWPQKTPTPSRDHQEMLRLWWPRLAGPAVKAAPKPLTVTVWTETVSLGRRNDLPDPVLAQMIDRGERGVRRGLRSWPENRRLVYRQERIKGDIEDTVKICWHFEPIEPE